MFRLGILQNLFLSVPRSVCIHVIHDEPCCLIWKFGFISTCVEIEVCKCWNGSHVCSLVQCTPPTFLKQNFLFLFSSTIALGRKIKDGCIRIIRWTHASRDARLQCASKTSSITKNSLTATLATIMHQPMRTILDQILLYIDQVVAFLVGV